eukprot:174045_1
MSFATPSPTHKTGYVEGIDKSGYILLIGFGVLYFGFIITKIILKKCCNKVTKEDNDIQMKGYKQLNVNDPSHSSLNEINEKYKKSPFVLCAQASDIINSSIWMWFFEDFTGYKIHSGIGVAQCILFSVKVLLIIIDSINNAYLNIYNNDLPDMYLIYFNGIKSWISDCKLVFKLWYSYIHLFDTIWSGTNSNKFWSLTLSLSYNLLSTIFTFNDDLEIFRTDNEYLSKIPPQLFDKAILFIPIFLTANVIMNAIVWLSYFWLVLYSIIWCIIAPLYWCSSRSWKKRFWFWTFIVIFIQTSIYMSINLYLYTLPDIYYTIYDMPQSTYDNFTYMTISSFIIWAVQILFCLLGMCTLLNEYATCVAWIIFVFWTAIPLVPIPIPWQFFTYVLCQLCVASLLGCSCCTSCCQ